MFGALNSGGASGNGGDTSSLPTTSASPSSANAFLQFPASSSSSSADSSLTSAFSSIFSSSPLVVPSPASSVIVHQQHNHNQLGPSPSLPLMGMSIEQQPLFNPLVTNLIAALASMTRHHSNNNSQNNAFLLDNNHYQQQQQQQALIRNNHQRQQQLLLSELFQMNAERLRQCNSSTPSSAMAGLSVRQGDNNSTNNHNGTGTTLLQNGNLINNNHSTMSPHQQQQQLMPLQPAPVQVPLQKTLSAVEILQRALDSIVVANQQQQKLVGNNANGIQQGSHPALANVLQQQYIPQHNLNGIATSHNNQQPQSQQLPPPPPYVNGTTPTGPPTATMLEQQLLTLLSLQQQQQQNNSHCVFPAATFLAAAGQFANGGCCGATTTATSTPNNHQNNHRFQNGHLPEPMDLSNPPQGPAMLFGNNQQQQQLPPARKGCDIRRSASSVSYKGSADVHEHFVRTFSGKWPRRQPSLRAHLQASGGRAAAAAVIGEGVETDKEAIDGERKTPCGDKSQEQPPPPSRPPSRRPASRRSVYTAVIRKLFTSNEVKQVEDHFRKSLGDDRFQQIKKEQKQREEKHNDIKKDPNPNPETNSKDEDTKVAKEEEEVEEEDKQLLNIVRL